MAMPITSPDTINQQAVEVRPENTTSAGASDNSMARVSTSSAVTNSGNAPVANSTRPAITSRADSSCGPSNHSTTGLESNAMDSTGMRVKIGRASCGKECRYQWWRYHDNTI